MPTLMSVLTIIGVGVALTLQITYVGYTKLVASIQSHIFLLLKIWLSNTVIVTQIFKFTKKL